MSPLSINDYSLSHGKRVVEEAGYISVVTYPKTCISIGNSTRPTPTKLPGKTNG